MQIDTSKCLDEIEGTSWGEPADDSSLVICCHRLRKKAVSEFTPEDLRVMIGQRVSLTVLLPLALDLLEKDAMASGDYFEGDLLASVSRVPFSHWLEHPVQYRRFQSVSRTVIELLRTPEYTIQGDAQLIAQLETAISTTIEGEHDAGHQDLTRAAS